MTNPVSTNPESQYPALEVPFVDIATGRITQPWARSYLGLWQRTGGADGVNTTDVQASVKEAVTDAAAAKAEASLALADAQAAQSSADGAAAAAAAAQVTANSAAAAAGGLSSNALSRNNNLSDVASASTSRVNLGLSIQPVTFQFDTVSASLTKYAPMVRSVIVPAGLSGTFSWAGTLPTADATFTLKRINGGTTSTIGTITIIHASNTITLTGSQVTLNAGDILALSAPSSPDATLAFVGISIALTVN